MVSEFLSLFLVVVVFFICFAALTKPGVALRLTMMSMDFQTSLLRFLGGH